MQRWTVDWKYKHKVQTNHEYGKTQKYRKVEQFQNCVFVSLQILGWFEFEYCKRWWVPLHFYSEAQAPINSINKNKGKLHCVLKKNAELEVISNWAESESIPQAVRLANIVIEYECKTTPDLSWKYSINTLSEKAVWFSFLSVIDFIWVTVKALYCTVWFTSPTK